MMAADMIKFMESVVQGGGTRDLRSLKSSSS
jgi:hypothetical protein